MVGIYIMVFEIKQSKLQLRLALPVRQVCSYDSYSHTTAVLTVIVAASRLLRACLWFCVATVEQRVGLSCCWLGLASLLPRGIAAQHEVQNLIPYQFQTE